MASEKLSLSNCFANITIYSALGVKQTGVLCGADDEAQSRYRTSSISAVIFGSGRKYTGNSEASLVGGLVVIQRHRTESSTQKQIRAAVAPYQYIVISWLLTNQQLMRLSPFFLN